ncbi:rCG27300 [Rattus norvegicus]|uniref:RCG27300 n=1 Tax=Rattus norvegicus TaxID=10116 RepID=A6HPF5_RAT|nr:rCG27300 [Rattus norvegicus]
MPTWRRLLVVFPDDAVHLRRKILLSMHFPFSQWGELPCLHLSNRRIGRGGGRGGVVLLFYLSLWTQSF